VTEYTSWRQVARYFDGDGTIVISDTSNQPYKISLSLIFVDQSGDQIRMVRGFLEKHGVMASNVLKTSKGTAHMVAVSRFEGVLFCLKAMRPFLFKKAIEAQAGIDYYEGRVRGDDLFAIFGEEVEAGRRERRERKVVIHVPFTYPEGDALMKVRRRAKIVAAIESQEQRYPGRTTTISEERISKRGAA
jgi:citrate lyase gamma subunit